MVDKDSNDEKDKGLAEPGRIAGMRVRLRAFLENNPEASLEEIDIKGEKHFAVVRPWGEDGLIIFLSDPADEIVGVLNCLLLPPRFSAIWHTDTKEFEIIWTAFPLSEAVSEIVGRKFLFNYDSIDYECEFCQSSERLLLLAGHSALVGQSRTNHRNLYSLNLWVTKEENGDDSSPKRVLGDPISFWVRGVDWDDEKVLRLVQHLNFFLTYYDGQSPIILVHEFESEEVKPQTRYLIGEFPGRIDSNVIEDDLLQLWIHSRRGDAARRFIYCFRIIEYASYACADKDARSQVRRLLSTAHARADIGSFVDQVIAISISASQDEVGNVNALLNDAVDFSLLWREIQRNFDAFTQDITFDGGYKLAALMSADATETTFKVNGISQFYIKARLIRNTLSHGRDKSTQTSITPTVANFLRLEPWVAAISVVAGEVINFKQ